ncbi:hypothetical protein SARC_02466 [Sphaeroforma arctica JP610]|uniref:Uncharacterized protein n=1 Tax=Sphaeroforma arctica JP610 TaxID=667725 RepID=A0A0L0G8L1_9EUKA|nr:hypothetical protein SARC_02466 [Sphaeroforma arctica JP610]KNC85345.1 hypothetical protein SARC_02466 [Sphaeroforma arctica JP610]|eukprot:XP_014159247.1 hypothetical protein SARC_02466 [Sphaeroforma arctica JP610]
MTETSLADSNSHQKRNVPGSFLGTTSGYRPLPTVGKQACDRLLKRLLGVIRRLTVLCDKVDAARARKPAPEDDKKMEIHLELTCLFLEYQYSIHTLGRLSQAPEWIADQAGHLNTMRHVQEATEDIHLIQEQLRQLLELSLADIDTSTPQDTAQATMDDDSSETKAAPTVQQHWAPQ